MYKNGAIRERQSGRLETLDLLRGLTLISMICYHGMWDYLYLSGTGSSMTALGTWYEGTGGHLWQQSICRTFILLSGFCLPFSRHIFRRGIQVSAGGIAVSIVTIMALYEDRVIFGVLTFLGAAMLVTGCLKWFFGQSSKTGLEKRDRGMGGSIGGLPVFISCDKMDQSWLSADRILDPDRFTGLPVYLWQRFLSRICTDRPWIHHGGVFLYRLFLFSAVDFFVLVRLFSSSSAHKDRGKGRREQAF